MNQKNLSQKQIIHLFMQPTEGNPISFKLDLRQSSKLVAILCFLFFILFLGTLFFFRELETNRKLHAEVLETKLKLKLTQLSDPQNIIPTRQLGYSVSVESDESLKKQPTQEATSPESAQKESWMTLTPTIVSARLGSLSSECQVDNCSVKLELLPSGNGISQGELLMILETEVPRIGSRGVSTQQRKQFIFYPGYSTKDEFNSSELTQYERRPFKFSKTLNASVNFKVSKLLRPLALNIYLFDSRRTLIHHERKVIDLEENYAN